MTKRHDHMYLNSWNIADPMTAYINIPKFLVTYTIRGYIGEVGASLQYRNVYRSQ